MTNNGSAYTKIHNTLETGVETYVKQGLSGVMNRMVKHVSEDETGGGIGDET